MKGLIVLIILDFWTLWSALSNSWCAINMSLESNICAASDSIENINSYIIVAIMAVMTAVMVIMAIDNDCMAAWSCIGVYVHRFWSVWLNIIVISCWFNISWW